MGVTTYERSHSCLCGASTGCEDSADLNVLHVLRRHAALLCRRFEYSDQQVRPTERLEERRRSSYCVSLKTPRPALPIGVRAALKAPENDRVEQRQCRESEKRNIR